MERLDRPDRSLTRAVLKDRARGDGRDGKFVRTPDEITDPDDDTKRSRIDHIFTVGFPWATDEGDAERELRRTCRQQFGPVIRFARIFREDSPEHEANGEYLMTGWIIDLFDRDRPEPPIGEGTER
jgi:hypothetical protein